jgi:hypothetical protein
MAVGALSAAVLSILLAAGTVRESDRHAATSVRSDSSAKTAGLAKEYERVEGPVRTLAPAGDPSGNDIGSSVALCPSGKRVSSGGYQVITGVGGVFFSGALTIGLVGWAVGAVNDLARPGTVQAFAYCVSSDRAARHGSSRLARQRAAARREIAAVVARYRVARSSQSPGVGGL